MCERVCVRARPSIIRLKPSRLLKQYRNLRSRHTWCIFLSFFKTTVSSTQRAHTGWQPSEVRGWGKLVWLPLREACLAGRQQGPPWVAWPPSKRTGGIITVTPSLQKEPLDGCYIPWHHTSSSTVILFECSWRRETCGDAGDYSFFALKEKMYNCTFFFFFFKHTLCTFFFFTGNIQFLKHRSLQR